jgi:divalent metal cation (Fe/Co/Zn/Cd) transporter
MKLFIYILIVVALGLTAYNVTLLDFENLLEGNSKTALIGICASLCVVVLMLILLVSKKIEQKSKSIKP